MEQSHSYSAEIPHLLWNPEGLLPFSQDPTTGPYPELDASSPQLSTLFPEDPV